MSDNIQSIAQKFYEDKTDRNFTLLYNSLAPTVYRLSSLYLKKEEMIQDNVSLVFQKIFKASDTFVFNPKLPFIGYMTYVTRTTAFQAMKYEKRKITVSESELTPIAVEGEMKDSILDILSSKANEVSEMDQVENSYLHNDSSYQFEKIIEILARADDKENAQIILDGLVSNILERILPSMGGEILPSKLEEKKFLLDREARKINKAKLRYDTKAQEFLKKNMAGTKYVSNFMKYRKDELDRREERLVEESKIINANMSDINRIREIAAKYGFNIIDEPMSYEDIAAKYGLNTVGAVKTKVFRGKKIIMKELMSEMKASMSGDGNKNDGNMKIYHDNGKIKKSVTYINGVIDGEYIQYYPDGTPKIKTTYIDGIKHGEYKEWYKNGSTKRTGEYTNDEKSGTWIGRYLDGSIDSIYEFHGDGGFFEHFDKKGNLQDSGLLYAEEDNS